MERVEENQLDNSSFDDVKEKVARVRERIDVALRRAGREKENVLLVGVSKYAAPNDGVVEGLLRAGVFDLAENRPQKLLEKAEFWRQSSYWSSTGVLPFVSPQNCFSEDSNSHLRWHFIGSLQRNKARRILPYVTLIHSIDSWKLLETLERILEEEASSTEETQIRELTVPKFPDRVSALLEVHISQDVSKQGLTRDETFEVLEKANSLKHVEIHGLMGMAGLTASRDETRRQFASLKTIFDECRVRFPETTGFTELSMGMSGDFEIAVEEGATIVRVGSALYPDR